MGDATPTQAPRRAGLAQKGNGKGMHSKGEAGQSRGEEVLYNALELNSNRSYKKKGDK